jgi:(p)ppGpp synthase/HD superfamily hydrolase
VVELGERFREALAYAVELHAGQTRKGTTVPYVGHLLGVCALVVEDGGDEDEAIAALLHDAGEDAGGSKTIATIGERFGDRVAGIVEECSDTLEQPKPPWRGRKEQYLARLERTSAEAIRVSLADKLYNVRTIVRDQRAVGDSVWERFGARPADVLWYYRSSAHAFRRRSASPMVAELDAAVAELERVLGGGAGCAD